MTQSVLSVRMDSDTKAAFAAFCDEVGMSVSTAINVFARQVVRQQRLPFEISARADESGESQTDRVLPLGEIKAAVSNAASHVPQIERVILFGSYARGDARPDSDVDLRIEYQGSLGLIGLGGFVEEIRTTIGKELDVVTRKDLGDDDFAQTVEREGVVLFER